MRLKKRLTMRLKSRLTARLKKLDKRRDLRKYLDRRRDLVLGLQYLCPSEKLLASNIVSFILSILESKSKIVETLFLDQKLK